jgi:methylmalonyl-CoA/ethylmalonyl-CoA epimerase
VGVVVKNMDKAIQYYQSLGSGPFEAVTTPVAEKKFRGKPAEGYGVKIRVAQLGNLRIELIQPIKGESPAKEFLDNKGEGINHVCFSVDDLDKEANKLIQKGLKVVSNVKFVSGGGNIYFDTSEVGGVLTELLQQPPK